MLSICRKFSFDAAHFLPNYEGLCHNLHGHNWNVEVEVTGPKQEIGSSKGMILDFKDLDKLVDTVLSLHFDHQLVNDTIENPTAENIVDFIRDSLLDLLSVSGVYLTRVRVHETNNSFAEWRID